MFRGFRPLRGTEPEPEALAPDAESLGHEMRRSAGIGDAPVDAAAPPIAPRGPAPASLGPVPTIANASEADAFEPENRTRDGASDVFRNFAADEADRRDPEHPAVRQSPLITSGYVDDNSPSASDARFVDAPAAEMLVPKLEDDDEPTVTAPVLRERPAMDDRWHGTSEGEGAGVDAVSLDETPQRTAPAGDQVYRSPLYPVASNPWQQQAPREAQPQAAPGASNPWQQQAPGEAQPQAAPVASNPWQQQAPREPEFEADPVTSIPSLDDLIMDGAESARGEDRGGFFSRLFGKQGKSGPVEGQPAAPMPVNTPQEPPTEAVRVGPAPSWAIPAPEPESLSEAVPEQPAVHEGYRNDFSPAAPEPMPIADPGSYGPASRETPIDDDDRAPQWTMLSPLSSPSPLPYAERQGFGEMPSHPGPVDSLPVEPRYVTPAVNDPQAGAPSALGHDPLGTVYSPDQLARPLGWETAGASALQAAAPDSAIEYRPVVQISPDSNSMGQEDYASAVFSELSSLASQRPQVETTRAGLAKRTPVAREIVPDEPVQGPPTPPRDAEAVRNRFLAFYSGTQRARDDVRNFNNSTQGSLTEP